MKHPSITIGILGTSVAVLACAAVMIDNDTESAPAPIVAWDEILTPRDVRWEEPLKDIRWWGSQPNDALNRNELDNSFERARALAKQDNRPLFVQVRCLP